MYLKNMDLTLINKNRTAYTVSVANSTFMFLMNIATIRVLFIDRR